MTLFQIKMTANQRDAFLMWGQRIGANLPTRFESINQNQIKNSQIKHKTSFVFIYSVVEVNDLASNNGLGTMPPQI